MTTLMDTQSATMNGDELEYDTSSSDATDDEAAMRKVLDLLGPDGIDPYEFGMEGSSESEEDGKDEEAQAEGDDSDLEGSEDLEDEQALLDDQDLSDAGSDTDDSDSIRQPPGVATTANAALDRVLATFQINASFWETQTLTFTEDLVIPDAGNDLEREVQFYKQALWAAKEAKSRFENAGKPFTRPDDYYAEMIKSDTHMERIRQRLLDESASIKASEDAKRMRHLKKFGKQVQVSKIQERQKAKKQLEAKVKDFQKKRKNNTGAADADGDDFDVTAERDDFDFRSAKRAKTDASGPRDRSKGKGRGDGGPRMPREARNQKYGRPQTSRRPKQNTKESTEALFAKPKAARKFSSGGKGGKAQRPGKSKRSGKK